VLAIQVLMQTVVVARLILEEEWSGLDLTGLVAALEEILQTFRI
jgi:hypothetical protein